MTQLTTNMVQSMDVNQINRMTLADRLDTSIELDGLNYRISFLPFMQTVIYTSLCGTQVGQFELPIELTPIEKPNDAFISDCLQQHLERTL